MFLLKFVLQAFLRLLNVKAKTCDCVLITAKIKPTNALDFFNRSFLEYFVFRLPLAASFSDILLVGPEIITTISAFFLLSTLTIALSEDATRGIAIHKVDVETQQRDQTLFRSLNPLCRHHPIYPAADSLSSMTMTNQRKMPPSLSLSVD